MPHVIYIVFLFALGSCVGSFLNVVIWRLPRVQHEDEEGLFHSLFRSMQALSDPPSHCPKCEKRLKWYDNIPVIGWIKLGGKCRFCKQPFSIRYPIVEAITGLFFAGYYWAYFIAQIGPCHPEFRPITIDNYGWLYAMHVMLISGLLAASLIDAELFCIPLGIPWLMVPVAVVVHTCFDQPAGAGSVCVTPLPGALALGAIIGVILSFTLLSFGILPKSFPDGGPMTEMEREEYEQEVEKLKQQAKEQKRSKKDGVREKNDRPTALAVNEPKEWSKSEIRREIRKEMRFLLLPLALGMAFLLLAWQVEPVARGWAEAASHRWVSAMLGSVLGGLVGGFVVWLTRILGTLVFGREAMGMGDVDLMVAVGAVLGAGPAAAAFFMAPFFGILIAFYMFFTGKKREIPFGPYLSLGTACVMLFYCPIAAYFEPGFTGLGWMFMHMIGAGGA